MLSGSSAERVSTTSCTTTISNDALRTAAHDRLPAIMANNHNRRRTRLILISESRRQRDRAHEIANRSAVINPASDAAAIAQVPLRIEAQHLLVVHVPYPVDRKIRLPIRACTSAYLLREAVLITAPKDLFNFH